MRTGTPSASSSSTECTSSAGPNSDAKPSARFARTCSGVDSSTGGRPDFSASDRTFLICRASSGTLIPATLRPRQKSCLALPVVDGCVGAQELLVAARGLRPDPDLAAVGVVHDGDRRLRREDQHAARVAALVRDPVRAVGPLGEDGDVTGSELALAV